MKVFLFGNKENKMIRLNKKAYLEMKYKVKYLEYYFMVSRSKEINMSKCMKKKIVIFIHANRYEELTNVEYSFNKKIIKMQKKRVLEMQEFALYSDELKKLI